MKRALYIAYFTGAAGSSQGLFYIGENLIAGIDVGGVSYDGKLSANQNGDLEGLVEFILPSGQASITGAQGGSTPQKVLVNLNLPVEFANGSVFRIDTPIGPVNARFEMLKELPSP